MADRSGKRQDYIVKEDYFMAQASLAEKRSKDPVCQVGACIVSETNEIVGIGYNTMPRGRDDDPPFTWKKYRNNALKDKGSFVCHAELNAIVNAKPANVTGSFMYVTRIPCDQCAKLIVQSGIREVAYKANAKYDNKPDAKISKAIFNTCRVPLIPWQAKKHEIEFNLTDVETTEED